MNPTDEMIDNSIDLVITRIAEKIMQSRKISQDEAIKYLLSTKTYKLLLDKSSKLYAESAEYVLDMIDAEEKNDIARLLEV
jgi:hypothetical protein